MGCVLLCLLGLLAGHERAGRERKVNDPGMGRSCVCFYRNCRRATLAVLLLSPNLIIRGDFVKFGLFAAYLYSHRSPFLWIEGLWGHCEA